MFVPIGTDRPVRRRPRVVEGLIILNMLIYLASLMSEVVGLGSLEGAMQWLSLSRGDFHVVNLITYQFAHSPSDILHLLFNMLGLWIFGVALNDRLGHLSFLAFYLIGGAVAGIAHIMDSPALVIGASGSVCALIGGFIALFPRSRIRLLVLFFIIGIFEVGSMWVVGFYILIDFVGWVGPSDSPVAYIAHLAGYLYGFLLAILLLATKVIRTDDFDVLYILRQKKRRAAWKQVVHKTQHSSASGVISSSDPKVIQQHGELRRAIQDHLQEQNWTAAAASWSELAGTDEHACLSEQNQLELANRLFAAGCRVEAASAYEHYLTRHPTTSQSSEVKLMLGLLYARHLNRRDDAKTLLQQASGEVRGDGQQSLVRQLLEELGLHESEQTS